MDQTQKNILNAIREAYPEISKDESILLVGSTALGFETKDSDVDVNILTNRMSYFKKITYEKGFRNKDDDAGFDKENLEVKFIDFKMKRFNVIHTFNMLTAKVLYDENGKFKKYQNEIKKQFEKNYESLLKYSYIDFSNDYNLMGGMTKRNDKDMAIALEMEKGASLKLLLRLAILMEKKPYPCDKWLYQTALKGKYKKQVKELAELILKINKYEDYNLFKKHVKAFFNTNIKRPYIGPWWKYLNEFHFG